MNNGATLLLELLSLTGVKHVFGYPGGAVIPLYDKIYQQDKITHYLVRHEQSAAHAAEAYGKVNNSLGVCIATSGPGATNLVTGIYNAFMDSNPLLCITGQVPTGAIGKMSFQEVDIMSITKAITKKNIQVKHVSELVSSLYELITLAQKGRKGPVLLDIPKDIFLQEVDLEVEVALFNKLLASNVKTVIEANDEDVLKVVSLLKESKKPVFLIGAGAVKADCLKELEQIIKYFRIPVVTTIHGLGVGAATDNYYGMAGMHGSVIANQALYNSDLVISFGSRFDDRLVGNNKKFAEFGVKVHIDVDEEMFNKNVKTEHCIHADLKSFVSKLHNENLFLDIHTWLLQLKHFRCEIEDRNKSYINKELHPQQLFNVLNQFDLKDAMFVTDVGQHQMWAAQLIKLYKGNQFITSGGAGTMGYALPAAIGTSVAKSNAPVIVFCGDGGVQMTSEELILLHQYQLNVKVFILNNRHLGMVRQWQQLFCDSRYSSTVMDQNPSFEMLAKANYLHYLNIEKEADLQKLSSVFSHEFPMVIEVMIEQEANVLPMIPANESFEEIIL